MKNNKIIYTLLGTVFILILTFMVYYYFASQEDGNVEKNAVQVRVAQPYIKESFMLEAGNRIYSQICSLYGDLPFIMKTELIGLEDIHEDRLLLWHDEFEESELDESKWMKTDSNTAEREYMYRHPDNVSVQDGKLILKASHEKYIDEEGNEYAWRTGQVNSSYRMAWRKGRIEAKMRWTTYGEEWTAFWTCGEGLSWPMGGEIDIMEAYHSSINSCSTIHYADSSAIHQSLNIGSIDLDVSQWHIWACEVDDKYLTIYVDDVQLGNPVELSNLDYYLHKGIAANEQFEPFTGLAKNIIFGMVLREEPTTNIDEDRLFEVDWVRVYAPLVQTSVMLPAEMHFQVQSDTEYMMDADITLSKNLDFQTYKDNYPLEIIPRFFDAKGNDITDNVVESWDIQTSDANVISVKSKADSKKAIISAKVMNSGTATITLTSTSGLKCSRTITIVG